MSHRPSLALVALGLAFLAAPVRPIHAGAAPKAQELSRDEEEARDFRLSWARVEKYGQALANLKKASESSPAVKAKFDAAERESTKTFADEVKKIEERTPEAAAAIRAAGITPREYVVMSVSLIGTFVAVGAKRQGGIAEYPPTVAPENAAFLEQNFDRVQALLAPYVSEGEGDEDPGGPSPGER